MAYKIDVESSFESIWRYNIFLMCGGDDSQGEKLYVVSSQDVVADEGHEVVEPPLGCQLPRKLSLESEDAESIRVILYIVPHTLPTVRDISQTPPFEMSVTIKHCGEQIYHRVHLVDQWSGDSIEINL